MPEIDPYAVLGVPRTASREEVARAYRALAKRHHPDAGARPSQTMARINEAWSILGSPSRRARWDADHHVVHPAHWAATPPEPTPARASGRPDARAAPPPPSRFDSPWPTVGVALAAAALVAVVLVGLSAVGGTQPTVEPAVVTDEITLHVPARWSWAAGAETSRDGHRVIAHLLTFDPGPDEHCTTLLTDCRWDIDSLPAGQASVLITAWEDGAPPVPEPVVDRPHGLDADRVIGGEPAVFVLRRLEAGLTAWWQLSPPGFPDRWIEVSATISGLRREQDQRLDEIESILRSLEFRGD